MIAQGPNWTIVILSVIGFWVLFFGALAALAKFAPKFFEELNRW